MLRAYLDRGAMLAAGATMTQERKGKGNDAFVQDLVCFEDHRIQWFGGDELYFHGDFNPQYDVPAALKPFVVDISFYDNFGYGYHPHRQLGEYRLATATAHLQETGHQREGHYHVQLRARNMDDLRELYGLIREGKIWPAKDYETEQVPPPFRHIRDLFIEAWKLIRRDISDRVYRIKERLVF